MANHRVESEVTGSVWKVVVAVGDMVASGDVLMVLESMKMEIPLESPVSGRVAELLARPQDVVAEGQVLVVVSS
ncbi:MAG TPA: acetyl-CoA carboxylase biotin carboxyl carrier protein subunit [Pseudomonadales bacterium]